MSACQRRHPGATVRCSISTALIERRGTHASKWDNMAKLSGITAPDAIPMWVADMDFAAPPGVTAALTAEVERGDARLLRRHRQLGGGAGRIGWRAATALQGRSGLGQPDAGHRRRGSASSCRR